MINIWYSIGIMAVSVKSSAEGRKIDCDRSYTSRKIIREAGKERGIKRNLEADAAGGNAWGMTDSEFTSRRMYLRLKDGCCLADNLRKWWPRIRASGHFRSQMSKLFCRKLWKLRIEYNWQASLQRPTVDSLITHSTPRWTAQSKLWVMRSIFWCKMTIW